MATLPDVDQLVAGEKAAWDRFVVSYVGLVASAVRAVLGPGAEIDDVVQDVFLRLCKDDYRLIRRYDPSRSGVSTWLTVVSRSVAYETVRRRRHPTQPIDDTPEAALAVEPAIPERVKIPPGLLSGRQQLILTMLYDREMEVVEVAEALAIDPQTVRSTHHKALTKLREHFSEETRQPTGMKGSRPA